MLPIHEVEFMNDHLDKVSMVGNLNKDGIMTWSCNEKWGYWKSRKNPRGRMTV